MTLKENVDRFGRMPEAFAEHRERMREGSMREGSMRVAQDKDRESLLAYLKKEVADCIYLYIDIMNYGVSSEHMKVWFEQEQEQIVLIVMKYYDSFQIYSHRKDCDLTQVLALMQSNLPAMISGRRDLIERLAPLIPDYEVSYGTVFVMDRYHKVSQDAKVESASGQDAREIAELICSDDEIGGHYTVEVLTQQLKERIETKSGRSYIIRDEGRLAAHTATYAETADLAVVGGTIVAPAYRDTNAYMLLSNYILQQLDREHKRAYTFSVSEKMIQYHARLHTKCGGYGKLVKKTEGGHYVQKRGNQDSGTSETFK